MDKRKLAADLLTGKMSLEAFRQTFGREYFLENIADVPLEYIVNFPETELSLKILEMTEKGEYVRALATTNEHFEIMEQAVMEMQSQPDFAKNHTDWLNEFQRLRKLEMEGKL